jgi:PAS domain S-box-containing protein
MTGGEHQGGPVQAPQHAVPGVPAPSDADALFDGPGEMRARCRTVDWAATPLGPSAAWPAALRAAVRLMLATPVATCLWCGPTYTLIYNDTYRRILGAKHPALGRSGDQVWDELWPALEVQFASVRNGGDAIYLDEALLTMERLEGGRGEDAWFTYSLSALTDESGVCLAVYNLGVEITEKVRARHAVAAATERLRDQQAELELTNEQLQENAAELEAANDELQSTAAQLQERTAEAEAERARATSILETMSDAHFTMDAGFRILTMNRAMEKSLDAPRDAFLGRDYWQAFPGSAGTPADTNYRRVAAEGVEVHWTQHYKDDVYDRDVEIDAYPTDGGGVAVFWREVTERVRREAALRESEARLRAIYDGTHEYIGLIAPDGTVLDCNRASLEFAGNTRDEVVGRPFWETPWFAYTPGAPALLRDAIARAAAGEFVRYEATLIRPSGEGITFDFSLHPIRDPGGRVVLIVPEGRDITERQRLVAALEVERARLEEVFRRAPSFIVAFRGPEQVYEFVNEAYYQLVGHRDIVGKPLFQALPELQDQGFYELLEAVRRTGEPWVGHETPVQLQRTPGAPLETRYLDMVFQALAEADGTRTGVVAHGSDVTAQVLARREVERLLETSERARAEAEAARAEAEAANRGKSEFLAVMSHELRTPLNAIGGYAELVEMGIRGPVTPQQREDLRRIQNSQRHLLGLINEVLNYAKIETGSVHYDVADVPVREALSAAESLVAPQARAKGLSLRVGDGAPSLAARADAEKLRQILVNLLSNAVKFTDPGGRIEISCLREDGGVRILVRDTGIGIPAEKLDAIFDPFVQVRADLTRPHEGTGLGLAISRDLARGMGGDLTAESARGQGSTFTLTLPAAQDVDLSS